MSTRLHHLMKRYPSITAENMLAMYNKQFQQYNQMLVTLNLAMSKSEIQRQDTIDVCATGKPTANAQDIPELNITDDMSENMSRFIQDPETGFYHILPCFSTGVFRVNQGRYIYFQVMDLNIEQKAFRVMLRDYREVKQLSNTGVQSAWEPGIYGIAKIAYKSDTDEYEILANKEDSHLFHEIYQQISPSQLEWNRMQKDAWQYLALANAKATEAKLDAMQTNNVIELARVFMRYTTLSNFILNSHKPKIAPGQEDKQARNREIAKSKSNKSNSNPPSDNKNPEIPEKLVRNVGLIKITSTRTPRTPSSKSIKNYKIPSWTSRGHTRTYKSGKTVYVRPSVHHRKALKNPENKIPQSVINVIDNTDKK